MRVWPGRPYPLGATWDGEGVNFALFSENATSVELCLFDGDTDAIESQRIQLAERTDRVWHCYLPDHRPGLCYGYRVHGPYAPKEGHRFNAAKLLLDPYAKAISGAIRWSTALLGYRPGGPSEDREPDPVNSAGGVPKSVVIDCAFPWGDDRALRVPWNRTTIYECHVRGMTKLHPDVPAPLRGTYLGLCSDPMLQYFLDLGVTALELLPIHQAVVDRQLAERGLANYWGYNSIGFFSPDVRYATRGLGNQVHEFKSMVKTLHAAGLEVILDVVYNRAYYRLNPHDLRLYTDFTGTGNSLNMRHPRTIQLIMDSLRYWVTDMHVDGFRFDLAPVLARELYDVDRLAVFFDIIHQDPTLAGVKLIAEPWDVGPGGYQVGNFPIRWAEWNGPYRDAVRRFWGGVPQQVPELASRLAGSSDIYQPSDRGAYASINFVTAHDGFTLHDLVSYEQKHNELNGEHNRDGHNDNISRNWGVEGPTDDPRVLDMRYRAMRNFLATLAFSQGVPMISHGDETARTQNGNNNAYAQDNEMTWVHWDLDDRRRELLAFTRTLFTLRQSHPVLRRRHFFRGEPVTRGGDKDLTWLRPDGAEMTDADWHGRDTFVLGMLIYGEATDETDDRGRPIKGDTLLLLINGGGVEVPFAVPVVDDHTGVWTGVIDTAYRERRRVDGLVTLAPYSSALLRFGADHGIMGDVPSREEVLAGQEKVAHG